MKATAKPYLEQIDIYIGGKSKLADGSAPVKLSSNENPLGASPRAIKAMQTAANQLHRYPEDGALRLREAIAAHHGWPESQLICGTGSDEIIRMLVHAYAGVGDEVIHSAHGFAMYRIYALQYGATPVSVPEQDLCADVDAIVAAVTARTKLVFLANPNNPTGTTLPYSEIRRLREALPEHVVLVIDGAYAEYAEFEQMADFADGADLVNETATCITRTFSKLYGLPALRLGYGYAHPDIIQSLYKVRSPFNVTQPAMEAAIASLEDREFIEASLAANKKQRDAFASYLQSKTIRFTPSYANFLLLHFDDSKYKAQAISQALLAERIIVREVANYGLPGSLRITIGTADEMQALMQALDRILT